MQRGQARADGSEPVKVVIFCGGLGVRMGEETQRIPKPMIEIGGRPILWHIMRYYAAWGHNEFVLCLGYKGDVVKRYFLEYNGAMLNDFVLDRERGRHEGRAAFPRPRRVADHVRRHRAELDDRRAAEGGRAAPRRRRSRSSRPTATG